MQTGLEKYLSKSDATIDNQPAYIRQIIRNQYIDNQRRKQKVAFEVLENEATLAIDTLSLEDLVIAEDQIAIIWDQLNSAEREIIYLWAVEGYTAKEISHETGQPRGSVLSKIHRIRLKLTTKMEALNQVGAADG